MWIVKLSNEMNTPNCELTNWSIRLYVGSAADHTNITTKSFRV